MERVGVVLFHLLIKNKIGHILALKQIYYISSMQAYGTMVYASAPNKARKRGSALQEEAKMQSFSLPLQKSSNRRDRPVNIFTAIYF